MATFNYSGVKNNTVVPILTKFGSTVTMTRAADMSIWERIYDPVEETFSWKNTVTGITQSTEPADDVYTANGVFTNVTESLLKNSLVKTSDKVLLITGVTKPQTGDVFTDSNDVNFSYVDLIDVNPTSTLSVLYKVVVRV